jgi:hypothetical protein
MVQILKLRSDVRTYLEHKDCCKIDIPVREIEAEKLLYVTTNWDQFKQRCLL